VQLFSQDLRFISGAKLHSPVQLAVTTLAATIFAAEPALQESDPLKWPTITTNSLPGTRWWWMGSAVNPVDLLRELRTILEAGFSTVEITPIYGVKGRETEFIDYLSPEWIEMLKATVSEAEEFGMNVDMVTGTGWCFGGPSVNDHDANALVEVMNFEVEPNGSLTENFGDEVVQALVAFSSDGESVDLMDKIDEDGKVDWRPQGGGTWQVYGVSQKPSGKKVKRPAPGGEGWMLNPLYPDAMSRYLNGFSTAFAKYNGPKPHAQFHDSYEYNSNWAPDLFPQFEKRRGYRLQTELPALLEAEGGPDHVSRVKCDYRETVSELIEESIARWTKWSHEIGSLSRDQAHGSPGNWLDIYAASDIPETEMFDKDRDILVSKFASSAAHISGRCLTSSETGTWVAEHFTETLADLKYLFDDLFLSGVNRIMYHGTTYSPADAPWPGWLFYASTQMNSRNAIWRDVPALNTYATRVQSVLQEGRSDNDILLYWPIHDLWHTPDGMVQQMNVHQRAWFNEQSIGKTASRLWEDGHTFDYVSDKHLQNAKIVNGRLDLSGNTYRAVVVPECIHMPVETLQKLAALVEGGAVVIFENNVPQDVPGFGDLEKRRMEFRRIASQNFWVTPSEHLQTALIQAGVRNEQALASHFGVHFVRRSFDGGFYYFIANRGNRRLDEMIRLSKATARAAILDPMTGRAGLAETQHCENGTEVCLQLDPGESLILHTFETPTALNIPRWNYQRSAAEPIALGGIWDVKFLEGGPTLPRPFRTDKLGSWTEFGDDDAQSFSGTAIYTLHFDVPSDTSEVGWILDLGKVCQSARVRINGKALGTIFIPPFRLPVNELIPKDNVLEVEVTSTSANRIRDLDRRGIKWKNFYDANIVNLQRKPFDASKWPAAEAGLIGPVTLQAMLK